MLFRGKYNFLSNFYPCKIYFEGIEFPSVEHAYQACKEIDKNARFLFVNCGNAFVAKKLGKKILENNRIRKDWDKIKLELMNKLIRIKFNIPELKILLLNTRNEELIETNYWNDTYWGVCNGIGENNLGKILMQVRNEIRNEINN